ncbi:MAG: universal stress protein [Pantoea sp.]|uniref:universal stress protein n=1 Tax=unclassified Pantoea TaxID=2630326 RepID=UPI002399FAC7|nr:universal stress protein [Pantoea sp.]MDE1185267.1 universal stress protein [Pantoea sp.]
MNTYTHALVLVQGHEDGSLLLHQAVVLAEALAMKITLAHISDDFREMNYVSDSLMNDVVSEDIIRVKSLMSKLSASVTLPIKCHQLVTVRRFEDVEKCIAEQHIDLLIAGHRNRFMGVLTSSSLEYINRLNIDVLIKHLPQ